MRRYELLAWPESNQHSQAPRSIPNCNFLSVPTGRRPSAPRRNDRDRRRCPCDFRCSRRCKACRVRATEAFAVIAAARDSAGTFISTVHEAAVPVEFAARLQARQARGAVEVGAGGLFMRILGTLLTGLSVLLWPAMAASQEFPNRPIRDRKSVV